jgi:intein-encoded DNA endonuclease-like protein
MPDRKPRASSGDVSGATPEVIRLYKTGKTTRQIAEETDISRESVRRILNDAGIELRPSGGRPRTNPPKTPLSQAEVDRLRAMVGFNPDDVDKGIRVL